MKKTKYVLSLILGTMLLLNPLCAGQLFNENLTNEELAMLSEGKTVIKKASYKKMCLNASNELSDRLIKKVKDKKPAYFAEVIKEFPYEGHENLQERFYEMLNDVESYTGIPYWSEKHQKYYDLYYAIKVYSREQKENSVQIKANLDVGFDEIDSTINMEKTESSLFYETVNDETVSYFDKFDCVDSGNLISTIILFRDGDKWICYGVGVVDAPSIFFLRSRIETSFLNRIKTFCSYFFDKITEP